MSTARRKDWQKTKKNFGCEQAASTKIRTKCLSHKTQCCVSQDTSDTHKVFPCIYLSFFAGQWQAQPLLQRSLILLFTSDINPYPTAFPYGNGTVLHFYQQQESSTTKTVHKVINKGLKTYV